MYIYKTDKITYAESSNYFKSVICFCQYLKKHCQRETFLNWLLQCSKTHIQAGAVCLSMEELPFYLDFPCLPREEDVLKMDKNENSLGVLLTWFLTAIVLDCPEVLRFFSSILCWFFIYCLFSFLEGNNKLSSVFRWLVTLILILLSL